VVSPCASQGSERLRPPAGCHSAIAWIDGRDLLKGALPKKELPSGKRLHNYGKSTFLMGKSTISMAMFNSYVSLPEGIRAASSNGGSALGR